MRWRLPTLVQRRTITEFPWTYVAGAVIGLVVAMVLYDRRILAGNLDVFETLGGDAGSGLAGFRYFVEERWSWPPFEITSLGPPSSSVATTDSLAALAIIAKVARPLGFSPEDWWGAWFAISLALQGVAAVCAVRAFAVRNWVVEIATATIAIFSPILLFRVGHPTLRGQFLVLFAIAFVGVLRRTEHTARVLWLGALLVLVSALTHPYFLAMVTVTIAASVAAETISGRVSHRQCARWCVGTAGALGLLLLLSGMVQRNLIPDDRGFILNSALLLWPVVPQHSGLWPSETLFAHPTSSEGFGYLGAGVIALVVGSVVFAWRNSIGWRVGVGWVRSHQLVVVGAGALVCYALSPRIVVWRTLVWDLTGVDRTVVILGLAAMAILLVLAVRSRSAIIASWAPAAVAVAGGCALLALLLVVLPGIPASATSAYRASGRMMWVAWYGLLVAGAVTVARASRSRLVVWLLVGCVVLQIADTRPLHGPANDTMIPSAERVAFMRTLESVLAAHDAVHLEPPLSCTLSSAAGFEAFRDVVIASSVARVPVDVNFSARSIDEPCPDPATIATDPATLTVFALPVTLADLDTVDDGVECAQYGAALQLCTSRDGVLERFGVDDGT